MLSSFPIVTIFHRRILFDNWPPRRPANKTKHNSNHWTLVLRWIALHNEAFHKSIPQPARYNSPRPSYHSTRLFEYLMIHYFNYYQKLSAKALAVLVHYVSIHVCLCRIALLILHCTHGLSVLVWTCGEQCRLLVLSWVLRKALEWNGNNFFPASKVSLSPRIKAKVFCCYCCY